MGSTLIAGNVGYQYSTTFTATQHPSTVATAATTTASDKLALLSARHPVPHVAVDITTNVACKSLSGEFSPSVLLLGSSLKNAFSKPNPPQVIRSNSNGNIASSSSGSTFDKVKSVDVNNKSPMTQKLSEWLVFTFTLICF